MLTRACTEPLTRGIWWVLSYHIKFLISPTTNWVCLLMRTSFDLVLRSAKTLSLLNRQRVLLSERTLCSWNELSWIVRIESVHISLGIMILVLLLQTLVHHKLLRGVKHVLKLVQWNHVMQVIFFSFILLHIFMQLWKITQNKGSSLGRSYLHVRPLRTYGILARDFIVVSINLLYLTRIHSLILRPRR